jgi:hypothetical protein
MILAPISVGELLDKISILQIKSNHTKSEYVLRELNDLVSIAKENEIFSEEDINNLLDVNQKLWDTENSLRQFEENNVFDNNFIEFARLVYFYNDKRASIKKTINEKYNSYYKEVKCYGINYK